MSLVPCLLYICANVVFMVLVWLYNRRPQRPTTTRHGPTTGHLANGFSTSVSSSSSRWSSSRQSSFMSILGLGDYQNFCSFEDHFSSFGEVAEACKRAGLSRCQLILGVDFSASNEWQGRKTFSGNCLHRVIPGKILNPYQKVISIIGRTLESFDNDNFIPAFGFGDKTTGGDAAFSFTTHPSGCHGFAEVLARYERLVPRLTLGGPTSFAPVIRQAIEIVKARACYHILIIIADGQVNEYGPTVDAIIEASFYPLSIVVVGVGDGPWDAMEKFDDRIPERQFDNFQFVNYHKVTAKRRNPDACLALHVMMEIPDQYKTIRALGYLDNEAEPEQDIRKLSTKATLKVP